MIEKVRGQIRVLGGIHGGGDIMVTLFTLAIMANIALSGIRVVLTLEPAVI